jgi:hypothetical protein
VNGRNESKKQTASPQSEALVTIRLAVFKQTGEEKSHLATITLSKDGGSSWTLQAAGPSDASIEKLRPVLDRFADEGRAAVSDINRPRATSPTDALADLLTAEGFIVEDLPAGDHQISFQVDLNDGLVVGTHAPMHPLAASSDDGVGRRVFEAIASSFNIASDELADEIDKQIANNNTEEALLAIKREADHGLFSVRPNERLLNSLVRIDISGLQAPDKRLLRDCRLIVAQRLDRFDVAGPEADAILAEDAETLDPQQKVALKMAVALGSLRRGHRETALSMLRDLVKEPSDLDAEGRGWAWRNISLSLNADDPEARLAAKLSADAFLEAGKKEEAGKSMMRLANILLGQEPAEAVKALDEMIAVLDKEGLRDRLVRGAALHAR